MFVSVGFRYFITLLLILSGPLAFFVFSLGIAFNVDVLST